MPLKRNRKSFISSRDRLRQTEVENTSVTSLSSAFLSRLFTANFVQVTSAENIDRAKLWQRRRIDSKRRCDATSMDHLYTRQARSSNGKNERPARSPQELSLADLRPSDDDVSVRSQSRNATSRQDAGALRKCLDALGCCWKRRDDDVTLTQVVRVNGRRQELILLEEWSASDGDRQQERTCVAPQPPHQQTAPTQPSPDRQQHTNSSGATTLASMMEYIRTKLHQSYGTMHWGSTTSHPNVSETQAPPTTSPGPRKASTGSGGTMRPSKSAASVMTSRESGVTSQSRPATSLQTTQQVRSSDEDSFEVIDLCADSNTELQVT